MAPSIKHQTGFIWAIPKALAGLDRATARLLQRLKCSLFSFCKLMRATCFHTPYSTSLTKTERQNSCCPPKKCTHYTISLRLYPTRAALRGDVIRCPPYWPSPLRRYCSEAQKQDALSDMYNKPVTFKIGRGNDLFLDGTSSEPWLLWLLMVKNKAANLQS